MPDLCIVCNGRLAEVPDRYTISSGVYIKKVCKPCNTVRVLADIQKILSYHRGVFKLEGINEDGGISSAKKD